MGIEQTIALYALPLCRVVWLLWGRMAAHAMRVSADRKAQGLVGRQISPRIFRLHPDRYRYVLSGGQWYPKRRVEGVASLHVFVERIVYGLGESGSALFWKD